jgi:hypothetical protein
MDQGCCVGATASRRAGMTGSVRALCPSWAVSVLIWSRTRVRCPAPVVWFPSPGAVDAGGASAGASVRGRGLPQHRPRGPRPGCGRGSAGHTFGDNRHPCAMPAVGELVRCTDGRWMIRPPQHCPRGHRLSPGRVLVGHRVCSCGGHTTWTCDCGAVVYAPPVAPECRVLVGPAAVR